jgi:serine/threonine protein kinase
MGRLAMLHSLNIVHRDIKPENILYSSSKKTYIFGDFGMNILLGESFNEKTLTKFAGTT